MMIDVSRYLYAVGKTKTAIKFLAAGLGDHPAHIGLIGLALLKKLFKRRLRVK